MFLASLIRLGSLGYDTGPRSSDFRSNWGRRVPVETAEHPVPHASRSRYATAKPQDLGSQRAQPTAASTSSAPSVASNRRAARSSGMPSGPTSTVVVATGRTTLVNSLTPRDKSWPIAAASTS